MFYGPPGTGKTFAAKVLASQVNADFKAISSGELKQGIIGETERKIRELFEWLKSGSARILLSMKQKVCLCQGRMQNMNTH